MSSCSKNTCKLVICGNSNFAWLYHILSNSPLCLCCTVFVTDTEAVMQHFNLRLALTSKWELDAPSRRTVPDKLHFKLWGDILKCRQCCTHTVHIYSVGYNAQNLLLPFSNGKQASADASYLMCNFRCGRLSYFCVSIGKLETWNIFVFWGKKSWCILLEIGKGLNSMEHYDSTRPCLLNRLKINQSGGRGLAL